MLLCADGSYYVGHTDDLEKRVSEHHQGGKCVYTSLRRPIKLVWNCEYPTRYEAKLMEARLKKWSRAKKMALIEGKFEVLRIAAQKQDWAGYRNRKRLRTE